MAITFNAKRSGKTPWLNLGRVKCLANDTLNLVRKNFFAGKQSRKATRSQGTFARQDTAGQHSLKNSKAFLPSAAFVAGLQGSGKGSGEGYSNTFADPVRFWCRCRSQ